MEVLINQNVTASYMVSTGTTTASLAIYHLLLHQVLFSQQHSLPRNERNSHAAPSSIVAIASIAAVASIVRVAVDMHSREAQPL